jgi:hypothetical protein
MEDWDNDPRLRPPPATRVPGAAMGKGGSAVLSSLGFTAMAVLAGVALGIGILLTLLFGAGCWLTGTLLGRERLTARAWGPVQSLIGRARAAFHWVRTPGSP